MFVWDFLNFPCLCLLNSWIVELLNFGGSHATDLDWTIKRTESDAYEPIMQYAQVGSKIDAFTLPTFPDDIYSNVALANNHRKLLNINLEESKQYVKTMV